MFFGNFGIAELIVILAIVILLFGRRLPDIGSGLGKAISNFKRSYNAPPEVEQGNSKKDEEKGKESL
ncbi:MAG: twin-arginine translocase TatA/TatE family subunit [bacterium]